MKALKINDQLYGPFQTITRGEGEWRCDGVVFQDGVIGAAEVVDWVPPAPPPPPVPSSITPRQARLALLGAGLLSNVDAAIDSLPEPQKSAARIEWEYATSVERNSPLVLNLTPALGLTAEQVDALFIQGAAL